MFRRWIAATLPATDSGIVRCRDWAEAPSAHLQGNLDGIGDVAGILRETLNALPDNRKTLRPLHGVSKKRIIGFSMRWLRQSGSMNSPRSASIISPCWRATSRSSPPMWSRGKFDAKCRSDALGAIAGGML